MSSGTIRSNNNNRHITGCSNNTTNDKSIITIIATGEATATAKTTKISAPSSIAAEATIIEEYRR